MQKASEASTAQVFLQNWLQNICSIAEPPQNPSENSSKKLNIAAHEFFLVSNRFKHMVLAKHVDNCFLVVIRFKSNTKNLRKFLESPVHSARKTRRMLRIKLSFLAESSLAVILCLVSPFCLHWVY